MLASAGSGDLLQRLEPVYASQLPIDDQAVDRCIVRFALGDQRH